MLQQYIENILTQTEFLAFLTKTQELHKQFIQDKSVDIMENFDYIQKDFIEMGRMYNHFIFTATEFILSKIKDQGLSKNTETTEKTAKTFLKMLEEGAHKKHPEEMSFFMIYRDKTRGVR